jgi:hypothetical protein
MELLEPSIKVWINETQIEADNASRELYNRLSQIIHQMMGIYPQQSKQAMEIEEIFNEMIIASIDFTYRRGFHDCFKLLNS